MRTFGFLSIGFLITTGLGGCNSGAAPATIEIGHVADKTRLDKAGDQAEWGIRVALHELYKDEALLKEFGGRKIEVRHTDTRGNLDAFEAEAVRLDSINRCLTLIGGLSPAETAALAHAKVPILTLQGQPVAGASNQIFYLGMSPIRQGFVLAKVLADDAKVLRVVIVQDERRRESAAFADSFQKTLQESRKQAVVSVVRFGKDAKWEEIVKRTKDAKPLAIVFACAVNDFNACGPALRKEFAGAMPKIVYAGDDGEQRLFELGGNTPIVLASAFYADPDAEKTKAFLKAYRDAFQVDADVHAALAYDGFRMLVDALKATAAQLTAEAVRAELQKTKDFAGLNGPLAMGDNRVVRRPLFVMRWQDGALTLIRRFDASAKQ